MATLFTKIIKGDIPSTKVYEDSKCIAILDINPNTKGHTLVIPKEEHETIMDCPEELLGYLMGIVKMVANKMTDALKCEGVNISINNKEVAGQEIAHLHIHVVPRFANKGFGPFRGHEKYEEGEMQKYGNLLKID